MNAQQLTDLQPWILLGSLFLFLGLETLRPLVTPLQRGWHVLHNVGLLAIQVAVNLGVSLLFVAVTEYGEQHQLGLFRQVDVAWGWQMLFSVVILDFVQYWGHRMLAHRIPFFWRFHEVHHSDSQLDVSSALRFHPGEAIGLVPIGLVTILLFGLTSLGQTAYFLVITTFQLIQHANVPIPGRVDKALSYVFITPNVHKVHHSAYRPETDSNFANVFSCWDRLFGTFHYPNDVRQLRFGLDEFPRHRSFTLWQMLKIPFSQPQPGVTMTNAQREQMPSSLKDMATYGPKE